MNRFVLRLNDLELFYERNYGIDKRKGWSVAIDGIFWVQFERNLVLAIIKTYRLRAASREATR